VANQQECEAALERVAARLAGASASAKAKLEGRSLSCAIRDLDLLYVGRLAGGQLSQIRSVAPAERAATEAAQLSLQVDSDDLVLLSRGELDFAKAWLSGRLKVEASIGDLLKLRSLL
jgi:predicted lipid carrier protein YhbT